MSSTPVRDALQRLRQEGLVARRQSRGFEVSRMSISDIRHLAELRWAIETGIVALAIKHSTPAQVDELRPLALTSSQPTEGAERIALNRDFHLAVAGLSGNARLVASLSAVFDASERFFYLGIDGLPRDKMSSVHMEILDAVAGRDIELAADLCKQEAIGNSQRVIHAMVERTVGSSGGASDHLWSVMVSLDGVGRFEDGSGS